MKSRIKLDYTLCMAIGQDAGNHNMRKNNREAWNEDDWNIAAETSNDLLDSIGYFSNNPFQMR